MRLLYLSLDCPLPVTNGMCLRTWTTLQALRAEGCRIVFMGLRSGPEMEQRSRLLEVCDSFWILDQKVSSLSQGGDWTGRLRSLLSVSPYAVQRFRSHAARELIAQLWEQGVFDAVMCDTAFAAVNVPDAVRPLIVNHHNVEHRIFETFAAVQSNPLKRAAAQWEGRKVRRWESLTCRRAALNLTCSRTDHDHLLALQPGARVRVVPNVIPEPHPRPAAVIAAGVHAEGEAVVFCGAFDWYPNRDAVEMFLSQVWPRVLQVHPRALFIAAGRNPPAGFLKRHRLQPRVRFTGTVPDMHPYLEQAAVVVVPLRIGSGTRLKILEAAAAGKAIVSTGLGAEGLEFNNREIVIADDPCEFAARVAELLAAPEARAALGRAARERVRQQYTPAALRAGVHQALAEMACEAGTGQPVLAEAR